MQQYRFTKLSAPIYNAASFGPAEGLDHIFSSLEYFFGYDTEGAVWHYIAPRCTTGDYCWQPVLPDAGYIIYKQLINEHGG